MKLLNLNIGIKLDNAEIVAKFINENNPDVICIQEIVRHLEPSVLNKYKSKYEIERGLNTSYKYSFFGPLWITNAYLEHGEIQESFGGFIEQGNEVISKYPIITATNEHFYKQYELALDWTNWQNEDCARSLQIVEIQPPIGNPFQIINIHGIWTKDKKGDERTIKQCKFVVEAAKRKKIPTIITGDFNLFPDTPSIAILNKEFKHLINEFNIKSTRPDFKDNVDSGTNVVDYIFVSQGIKVNNFEVVNTDISDHLPLILDFEVE